MRIRLLLTSLFTVLLVPLLVPSPVAALSCVDPTTAYEMMDVVVEARVTGRPSTFRVELAVDRYYKGSGPAAFQAEIQGIEPGKELWMNDLVLGQSYLLGFVRTEGRLVHRPCDVFWNLSSPLSPELLQKMGEGSPPVPGTGQEGMGQDAMAEQGGLSPRVLLLSVGGAALLVGLGLGLILRRRTR